MKNSILTQILEQDARARCESSLGWFKNHHNIVATLFVIDTHLISVVNYSIGAVSPQYEMPYTLKVLL